MGESQQRPRWSVKNLENTVEKYITDIGFPEMEKPDNWGNQYYFPNDVSKLRWEELGNLQLRLSGWLSYGLRLQGKEETSRDNAQNIFDVKLWAMVAEQAAVGNKKSPLTKEMIRGKILMEDEELAKFYEAILVKTAIVNRIKIQNQIYSEQIQRLSREQTRREREAALL